LIIDVIKIQRIIPELSVISIGLFAGMTGIVWFLDYIDIIWFVMTVGYFTGYLLCSMIFAVINKNYIKPRWLCHSVTINENHDTYTMNELNTKLHNLCQYKFLCKEVAQHKTNRTYYRIWFESKPESVMARLVL